MTNTTFITVGDAGRWTETPGSGPTMVEVIKKVPAGLHLFHRENGEMLWDRAPDVIAQAAQLFLNEESHYRKRAIENSAIAGMSPPMMREALKNFFSRFKRDDLESMRELRVGGNSGIRSKLPRLVFHIFAGNLFLSSLESLIHASLCGACSLGRCSSQDPVFPQLWTDAVAAIDPRFAASLAVAWWPKELEGATRTAGELSDATVAFGDDQTIAKIRALTDGTPKFVMHGFKVSFAVLPRGTWEQDIEKHARALAHDFSLYDQAGCLSPRAAFIQTDSLTLVGKFAELLTEEMRVLSRRLPPHALSLEEGAALACERNEALIDAAAGGKTIVKSCSSDPFVVTLRPASDYRLGTTNRFCDLRTFSSADDLSQILAPFEGQISTIGKPGDFSEFPMNLGTPNAHRVCSLGQMQLPPLDWFHDGYVALIELLEK